MGQTLLTGKTMALTSTFPAIPRARRMSRQVIKPVARSSPMRSCGLPNHRLSFGGTRSWSNKQRPSRFETHNSLSTEHSRLRSAAGLARCGGFGGERAASDILLPFHTSLCLAESFLPTGKIPAPAAMSKLSSTFWQRSCLPTSLAYSRLCSL